MRESYLSPFLSRHSLRLPVNVLHNQGKVHREATPETSMKLFAHISHHFVSNKSHSCNLLIPLLHESHSKYQSLLSELKKKMFFGFKKKYRNLGDMKTYEII